VLVRGQDEAACRAVFGDHDHPSYAEALEQYYERGAPPDWSTNFISAYATMHPWEDFAETFAFYLNVVTVQDTAQNFGLGGSGYTANLDDMLRWFGEIGLVMNEINRDMGLTDLTPEVITSAIRDKLNHIHRLVQEGSQDSRPCRWRCRGSAVVDWITTGGRASAAGSGQLSFRTKTSG